MVIFALYCLLPVLLLIAGYLELATAVNRQAARGVVLIVVGAALGLWLLSNING